MAGFPDEIEMPFQLDTALGNNAAGDIETQGGELERMEELLMIKSGMIGHERTIQFMPVGQDREFRAASYYIDNVMHSGGSGGPLISESGHVVGVISKRAVTVVTNEELKDPNQELPSGSALAISAFSMTDYVHRQIAGLL